MIILCIVIIVIAIIAIVLYPFLIPEKVPHNFPSIITYENGIPKVIFRTWNTRYVNRVMYQHCHQKWLDLNSDFCCVWFTQRQRELYLQKYSRRIYNAYQSLKPGAFQADLWRACILYEFGGVYADAHTTPFKSLRYILSNTFPKNSQHKLWSLLDCKQGDKESVNNGLIVVTPHHPILQQYIEDMLTNIEFKDYTDHVLGITGPICFARAIKKVNGPNLRLKSGFCHGTYPLYLYRLQWGPRQYVYKDQTRILSKKYSILDYFYQKIVNRRKSYAYLWRMQHVY